MTHGGRGFLSDLQLACCLAQRSLCSSVLCCAYLIPGSRGPQALQGMLNISRHGRNHKGTTAVASCKPIVCDNCYACCAKRERAFKRGFASVVCNGGASLVENGPAAYRQRSPYLSECITSLFEACECRCKVSRP